MRASAKTVISAPIQTVWEAVSDPERALSFMSAMTRWEVAGDRAIGLGARYRMLFRIGSAEVGGLIEVVEWDEPRDLAWTSVTGIDQRGRWRLREMPGGRTAAEIRLSSGVAGAGLSGWAAERIAAPAVKRRLHSSVEHLKRLVENERWRELAAARRATRSS